jgi:ribose transport system substrate-binding protein
MRKRTIVQLAVLAVVASVALGCGGSNDGGGNGSSATSASAERVLVDVGNGKPIEVDRGKPNVAMLWTSGNLFLEAFAAAARKEAAARGIHLTVLDAKFDPVRQMQQAQNVLQQKRYDALIAVPLDGNTMCPVLTKDAPGRGIPVVTAVVPMCNRLTKPEGDALWSPGTVAHSGYTATVDANQAMYREVARRRGPGKHVAALLVGPPLIAGSLTSIAALKDMQKKGELDNLNVKYTINTDFTTPDGLAKTQTLLQAHPEVDTIMSIYSDITVGAIRAIDAAGRRGKVKVYDQGASGQSLDAIRAGKLEMTTAFYPATYGKNAVDAIADAFEGKKVKRWLGAYVQGSTPGHPLVIDRTNIDDYKPEY